MSDLISRQAVGYKLTALVNEFEEILSHIREREVNDSVCGLCEYDGAYVGASGDWCNECPGFDKDDCFKLSDERRKKWLSELDLPSAQPLTDEDYTELHDRFGTWVEEVVRDMISGEGKRWGRG